MNVNEKIAPLVVLQGSLPAHVESMRFDEGADGEAWVYVNAPPGIDPNASPRYLGFVARDDAAIEAESAALASELEAWLAGTGEAAANYQAAELVRLQNLAVATAQAQAQVYAAQQAEALVADVQQQYAQAIDAAATSLSEAMLALGSGDNTAALAALAVKAEQDATAAELKTQVDAQAHAVADAVALFLASLTESLLSAAAEQAVAAGAAKAKALANSPPARLVDRLDELQGLLGHLVVHQSTAPGQATLLGPGEVEAYVQAQAEWMLAG